jgi:FxLD family lantipeptide
MTAALVDIDVSTDVFDLDVRVETDRVRPATMGCQTDDGCGQTCQISACHSQN